MAKTFPNTGDALALAAAAAAARFKPQQAPAAAPAAPVPAAPAAAEAPALPEAAPTPAPVPTRGPARRQKPAQPPVKQAKVQFNIVLPPGHRERLRAAAFAYGTTERELIERFIEQLPDVEVQAPEPPRGMAWMRPR